MDNRYDFYKEQYYFELNRKNDLTNSLAIPVGFLTALLTGYAYFLLNLQFLDKWYFITTFVVLIIVSIYYGGKAVFHLFHAFRGLDYGYVPEPKKIYLYEQDYSNYVITHGLSYDKIDESFFNNLKKSLVVTTNKNRENNNFRSKRILKANIYSIYAILFLFLSTIPFIINKNIHDNRSINSTKTTTYEGR